MPHESELRPGGRVGPYEIEAHLGAGGMGEVWRARDPRLDRRVALKLLPAELATDPERLARFEREAKALAALNHPNIVTIHSVEEAEGVRFLTMELVEGRTLDDLIPPGGLDLDRFLHLSIPLAEAVAVAHERGVLHRDLKPVNVMVTGKGRVKVLDFGLAKLAGEPAGDLTGASTASLEELTREGRLLGTTPYLSPEQIQGRPADARSDVFSLGVVLYEMAAGRRPFEGASPAEVIASILRDEPVSVTEARPEMEPELDRVLRRCLAKDPERRFRSAEEVRDVLQALEGAAAAGRRTRPRDDRAPGSAPAPPAKNLAARGAQVALGVILVLMAAVLWVRREAPSPAVPSEAAHPVAALAVLPFRDLSGNPAHAYFAAGLHDELLTQLSRVFGLSVRGRASVMGYAGTTKTIRQIAEELEVGVLLEGSVQVVGDRLRVSVQLLDAATDQHLWAETYDRTLDDAFAIQSEVAQRVVGVVGVALGRGERRAMTQVPTADPEAYRYYLQGLDYHRRPGFLRQNWEIAQELYERALELDPGFALALAALSEVHGEMHWWRYDPSPARLEAQRAAAEEALRLAPELPQARQAMAIWHYTARRDWSAALAEFEIALRGLPNDAWLVALSGYAHRRLGNWDAVFAAFDRATALDPRNPEIFAELGATSYRARGRFAEAVRAFDQALALAPDLHWAAVERGWTFVEWQGRLDALRSALDGIPPDADLGALGIAGAQRAELLLWERDADGLLGHLEGLRDDVLESQHVFLPKALYQGWAYRMRGDHPSARAAFEAAWERLQAVPDDLEDDRRLRVARGLVLGVLGRREEALAEARWIEESEDDAIWGLRAAADRAAILAEAGQAEAALDEIERLLAAPWRLTAHTLRLDPRWDPVRAHPRFQRLIADEAGGE